MRALLMMVPLVVGGAVPGYKHVGGHSGVEVYRQMQSPDIDLLAEGDIDAPPSMVRDIVLDYQNASKLSDHVAESRVLSAKAGETVVYQRLKLPVVSDRDFTLRTVYGERNGMMWTRFVVDNSRGPEQRDQIVRVSTLNGGWDLTPTHDGHGTHAVYRVRINLAGSVPRWMVSGGAAKDLPKLFEGVRHRVQQVVARASR
jgi:hypothetical protein